MFSLQEALGRLCVDSVTYRNQLILHRKTFGGELTPLQDHLGCDPGLTEAPRHIS